MVYLGGGVECSRNEEGIYGLWAYNLPLFDCSYPTEAQFFPEPWRGAIPPPADLVPITLGGFGKENPWLDPEEVESSKQ